MKKFLLFILIFSTSLIVSSQATFNYSLVDVYNKPKNKEEFKKVKIVFDEITVKLYDDHIQVYLKNNQMLGYYTITDIKEGEEKSVILNVIGECNKDSFIFVFLDNGELFVYGENNDKSMFCNHYK